MFASLAGVTLIGGTTAVTSGTPQCSDGIDNSSPPDGLIDYPVDPGCTSLADATEQTETWAGITGVYKSDGTTMTDTCQALCGGTLTNRSTTYTVTSNSTHVDCLRFTNNNYVNIDGYDDVTVRCNYGVSDIVANSGTPLRTIVEDNDINGREDPTKCINFLNGGGTADNARATIKRNDVQGCEDLIFTDGDYITIEGNYLHDIMGGENENCPAGNGKDHDCHSDSWVMWTGAGVIFNHNNAGAQPVGSGQANSRIFIDEGVAAGITDLQITDNYLSGGGNNVCMYHIEQTAGTPPSACPQRTVVTGNRWETGVCTIPITTDEDGTSCNPTDSSGTWSNNKWTNGTTINEP